MSGFTRFSSSPSLQNKNPGGGAGSTSRGWRCVCLGVEMGGFRDQGVETGRFSESESDVTCGQVW